MFSAPGGKRFAVMLLNTSERLRLGLAAEYLWCRTAAPDIPAEDTLRDLLHGWGWLLSIFGAEDTPSYINRMAAG